MKSVLVIFWLLCSVFASVAGQPNVIWLVSEDNSKHWLRVYNEGGTPMPNVERLAKEGLVFENAFSCAPVCSVARTTLLTGCYAPRIGAQYHRNGKAVPMPDGVEPYPNHLQKLGYYTTNNAKEDYNVTAEVGWDESSRKATYRNRKDGQPFFHVQNFHITHEGKLHFPASDVESVKTVSDPAEMTLFPNHPDTKLFRYTYARYQDNHRKVDEEIGAFLKGLEDDGLMDDTIIFYYGDHGGVLPGSKGYIYEVGLQVPLIVRFPEKWAHLAPAPMGTRVDGFVSFVDFGTTVINLLGGAVPQKIDGRPFLGKGVDLAEVNSRSEAFGYGDRFDEKYDLVRSLRRGKFKYIRNYQPYSQHGLFNDYRYKQAAYHEWRDLYRAGKLNEVQGQFFETRGAEELFDLESDPHETKNLAGDAEYAKQLQEMRGALREQVVGMPDLSLLPETVMLDEALDNPVAYGQKKQGEIRELAEIADLELLEFDEARDELAKALSSQNSNKRYWALVVCSAFGEKAREFVSEAKKLADSDSDRLVKMRAAEFLGLLKAVDPAPVLKEILTKAESGVEATLILNTVALLKDKELGYDLSWSQEDFAGDWAGKGTRWVEDRLRYLSQ